MFAYYTFVCNICRYYSLLRTRKAVKTQKMQVGIDIQYVSGLCVVCNTLFITVSSVKYTWKNLEPNDRCLKNYLKILGKNVEY